MGQNLFDVSGKKVIVTGGTRGLGLGMAEGFLQAGCKVAIVGTSDKVFAVAEEECNKGYDCVGIKGDFSKREEVYRIFHLLSDRRTCEHRSVFLCGITGQTGGSNVIEKNRKEVCHTKEKTGTTAGVFP